MKTADLVRLALETLRLHRLRTGLTLAAVGIGACAVLLLTSLGDAAKRYVVGQFASIGTNIVSVVPGRTETFGLGTGVGGATHDLTLDDAAAIAHRVPEAADVAPIAIATAQVEHGTRRRDVYVVGASAAYQRVRQLRAALGELLPEGDLRRGDRIVVLGAKLRTELYGDANPVGTWVRVGDARFRVIGVAEPKGRSFGVDMDDMAMMPVATAMRLFDQKGLHRLMVQARTPADVKPALEHVREVVRERHREEDFTVITQDAMLESFRRIIDALTIALACIAAISLAVAGIGIMNVMLVSVSERVGEIGLLKALGAPPRRITALFLAEALLLAGAGAVAGLAIGSAVLAAAGAALPALALRPGPGWAATILVLALAVGALFGWVPARRAAAWPAADALRGRR